MNELAKYELDNIMNEATNISCDYFERIKDADTASSLASLSPIIEGVLSVAYNSIDEVEKALQVIVKDVLHHYAESN